MTSFKSRVQASKANQPAQEENIKTFLERMDNCTDYVQLRNIHFEIKEYKSKKGYYAFTKSGNDQFREKYREVRTKLYPAHEAQSIDERVECEGLINEAGSVNEVDAIEDGIRQSPFLTGDVAKGLYDKCKNRRESLAA